MGTGGEAPHHTQGSWFCLPDRNPVAPAPRDPQIPQELQQGARTDQAVPDTWGAEAGEHVRILQAPARGAG